ncbi:MAG: PAS-domain containing protein [Pseudomonadota bacterium]
MTDTLINPTDSLARQNEKLLKISAALMRRVEQATNDSGAGYQQFQRAAMLEEQVRDRTRELERALDLLNESNGQLAEANRAAEIARSDLSNAIETVQEGFALFNADEMLVMCNSRFGMHMPDIRQSLMPGLSFEAYVELVSRSRYLALPEGDTPEGWARSRKRRHTDSHVIFNVHLTLDRWIQVSEHRTQDGGTVILQTDVTDMIRLERQERERMLDDQARIIRATLEHINQGVCIFDKDLRLVGWNQRVGTLLSIPAGRFALGTGFDKLFAKVQERITFSDPTMPDRLTAWVYRQTSRPPLSFEVTRGSTLVLDVFGQEMPDRGFVISFTDVTAERHAIQALYEANESLEQNVLDRTVELAEALKDAERANASKSRFVAAASHDLLQPLSAAKLYISSLDGAEPHIQDIANRARSALHSVEGILEALLDISKLDSGRSAVDIAHVPLARVFDQIRDEFAPLAAQKGLDLSVIPCSAIVRSDATYLKRILQNLTANAIRYTQKGRVVVGARRQGNTLRLEVWDTGPGIPEEAQAKIFREFQRLDATASASEGMGLGLAIVERACALLSHPLSLWSVVGRGTGFFVVVPAVDEIGPAQGVSRATPAAMAVPRANLIALLVENDADVRAATAIVLENWGVNVLEVASEAEARDLLQEIEIAPDVILADYHLDNGALGTDVIRAIRDIYGPLPACLLTANRSPYLRTACKREDIELICKPVDETRLRTYLSNIEPNQPVIPT